MAVEACPIGPIDPRLPDFRNGYPNGPGWAGIFQEPDEATGFNNAAQFLECGHLKLIGKRAEQEGRYGTVKVPIRIFQSSNIHLPQLDWRGCGSAPPFGSGQHCWAQIDTNDVGRWWIKWEIPTSADACIQEPTREASKQERPDLTITTIFKRQIEQIVEGRYALIAFKVGHSRLAL